MNAVEPRRRPRGVTLLRVAFATAIVAALGLGFWGLWLHVPRTPGHSAPGYVADLVYGDLQLFVLDSWALDGGPYPLPLDIARFVAPLATVYALGEAFGILLGERLARRRLRRRKGHTIVIGSTPVALAIARGLTAGGARVVMADRGDPETLAAKGVAGAAMLFACESEATDRGVNVATVLAAASARAEGGLFAYAHVRDPGLALTLRARRLGLPDTGPTRLDFFNVDEVAARLVVESADLEAASRPRVLIAGMSTFGRAVLVEFARHWRLRSPYRDERPVVTVVDEAATAAVAETLAQWPFVAEVCEVVVENAGVDEALRRGHTTVPTTAYLCYDDEELALRTALSAATLWQGGPRSLVVRLDIMSRLGTAFRAGDGRTERKLLDDLDGRLLLVGVTEIAPDAVTLIRQDLVERLARGIHERYLLARLDAGTRLGETPAMALWGDLGADLRRANLSQASDIGARLRSIGCTVAPLHGDEAAFAFTAAELEWLAEHEHVRWMAERRQSGWRYGPMRDDENRRNPAIVPWAELPEEERRKDRAAVAALPAVLADAGLRIVRLEPPP